MLRYVQAWGRDFRTRKLRAKGPTKFAYEVILLLNGDIYLYKALLKPLRVEFATRPSPESFSSHAPNFSQQIDPHTNFVTVGTRDPPLHPRHTS